MYARDIYIDTCILLNLFSMSFRPDMLHEDPPFTRKNTTQFWIQTWAEKLFHRTPGCRKAALDIPLILLTSVCVFANGTIVSSTGSHVWETPISLGCATQSGCLGINSPCCGVHGMYYIMDDFSAVYDSCVPSCYHLLSKNCWKAMCLRSSVF